MNKAPLPKGLYDTHPLFNRVIFAYGFRPFFILSAGYAALTVLLWAGFWYDLVPLPDAISVVQWHAHEMLFGVIGAALGGFLLTAVPELTADPSLKSPGGTKYKHIMGRKLALLVALWLAGRVAMWMIGVLPIWLVALVNLAYLLILMAWTVPDLWRERQKKHRSFAFFIPALFLAQIVIYLGWLELTLFEDWPYDIALRGLDAALNVFLIGISLVVTRVSMVLVPMALDEQNDLESEFRPIPPRRNLAVATLSLFALADFFIPENPVAGWVALAAAAAQLDRLADWHVGRILLKPYVLVVYLTHVWMAVGLAGIGLHDLAGWDDFAAARHALALGAASLAVVAVYVVAGLEHTGRAMVVSKPMLLAIALINLATALRVVVPPLLPDLYVPVAIGGASVVWAAAFAVFLWDFWPALTRPRPDGKPG
ncbi:MAG: hypothetical protein CSA68_00290 [Rhodobacterales bacterium]|nr:MAG: hypothetical protein CSA68_00290 [Rhodobacterales bacterium]